MNVFVIYASTGPGGRFRVEKFHIRGGLVEQLGVIGHAHQIDQARRLIPRGLATSVSREANDHPSVIESWF